MLTAAVFICCIYFNYLALMGILIEAVPVPLKNQTNRGGLTLNNSTQKWIFLNTNKPTTHQLLKEPTGKSLVSELFPEMKNLINAANLTSKGHIEVIVELKPQGRIQQLYTNEKFRESRSLFDMVLRSHGFTLIRVFSPIPFVDQELLIEMLKAAHLAGRL